MVECRTDFPAHGLALRAGRLLQKHEFPEGEGNRWCKHCGCLWHAQMTATCLQRAIPAGELAPEPKRRQMACEDATIIAARLIELAKERLPLDPAPDMDPGDCCG